MASSLQAGASLGIGFEEDITRHQKICTAVHFSAALSLFSETNIKQFIPPYWTSLTSVSLLEEDVGTEALGNNQVIHIITAFGSEIIGTTENYTYVP